ncbi:hypothetical protein [Candidatus Nitrosocosmicus arcticus]|uniref:Uncharacterized protein n=1 Tax=Candidatus Nitrosocosmicus arcticus TaxID=2035267 RepID=A0A557STR7_9ARCH|nr:hypothetical protein [Candidatus Nitrosocosmicus arcticus]TVP40000.1 hypothetical protein NARC_100062 [Candidatus Nitrosocosmicus arcticus]
MGVFLFRNSMKNLIEYESSLPAHFGFDLVDMQGIIKRTLTDYHKILAKIIDQHTIAIKL